MPKNAGRGTVPDRGPFLAQKERGGSFVNTIGRVPNKPKMVMKSHRYPKKLYDDAMAKAAEREENLSDVLRTALEAYVAGQDGE